MENMQDPTRPSSPTRTSSGSFRMSGCQHNGGDDMVLVGDPYNAEWWVAEPCLDKMKCVEEIDDDNIHKVKRVREDEETNRQAVPGDEEGRHQNEECKVTPTAIQGGTGSHVLNALDEDAEHDAVDYKLCSDGDMYIVSGGKLDNSLNDDEDNMYVDGPYGTELKVEKFQVRVSDPEIRTGSAGPLGKYIVYLITGCNSHCGQFSGRKRYSDFQWLRDQLVLTLPGAFIPPLPRKQKFGRFEEQFVEARRNGLKEFLSRLLNRKNICETSLLKSWLVKGEGGMELLRREFGNRRSVDVLMEYKSIYSSYDENVNSCSRSHLTRFIWFKQFLQKHLATLQELHENMSKLASLCNCQYYTLNGTYSEFCKLKQQEDRFISKLIDLEQDSRDDISDVIYAEAQRRASCPGHVFDIMEMALGREIEDTECMLDAAGSLDRLVNLKHQAHHNTNREEQSLRSVQRSTRGGLMAMWFQRKDKDTQMHEIRFTIENLRAEIVTLDELIDLARLVLVNTEMPDFLKSKIKTYNMVVRDFVYKQRAMALEESEIWRSYLQAATDSRRVCPKRFESPGISSPRSSSLASPGMSEDTPKEA